MRLIDADRLESSISKHRYHYFHKEDVIAAIANEPTVDAVEVVRCKDCQKCLIDNSKRELHLCMKRPSFPVRVKLDDFCSLGERSTDG